MGRHYNLEDAILTRPTLIGVQSVSRATNAITALVSSSLPGTAKIPAGAAVVVVTAGTANDVLVLPDPVVGQEIVIIKPAAGAFELRSSAPATIAINGGVGAAAEAAILTTSRIVRVICTSLTTWIAVEVSSVGVQTAVDAAA
jgi:hypothetical protein